MFPDVEAVRASLVAAFDEMSRRDELNRTCQEAILATLREILVELRNPGR